jgi:hypothetical protein
MSEVTALKVLAKARSEEEKRATERRRNALVLILRHLADNGYSDSYERLSTESGISLAKVCLGGCWRSPCDGTPCGMASCSMASLRINGLQLPARWTPPTTSTCSAYCSSLRRATR